MQHDLKISPRFFDAVQSGIKPFEVRKKDRPFTVGDTLLLSEYDPETGEWNGYTGRQTQKAITYILDDPQYCPEGYVILGIKAV